MSVVSIVSYISLYRKWRPQLFGDIIGQQHVVKTLENAIEMNRVSHAFLFSGPRGTGKTSMAKVFARAVNCENGPSVNPCGKCASCVAITDGSALDVIEIDAASNRGIDEMRDLREKVKFAPSYGKYKVYIIDEAHMLTTEASNALLKTLEEPPSHTIFILATTESNRIIPTILSRCQRFDFKRLSIGELSKHLMKVAEGSGIKVDQDAIALIARRAEGGVRDALSILDQASSFTDDGVTLECVTQLLGLSNYEYVKNFVNAIAESNLGELFRILNVVLSEGGDLRQFLSDLIQRFMNILIGIECKNSTSLINALESEIPKILEEASKFERERVVKILSRLSLAEQEAKRSPNVQLTLELAVASICVSESAQLDDIDKRLRAIENGKIQNVRAAVKPNEVTVNKVEAKAIENEVSDVKDTIEPVVKDDLIENTSNEIDWQRIMMRIREKNMPLFALLEPVVEVELSNSVLNLGFKQGWPIHYKKASEEKSVSIVTDAVKDILGISVRCEMYIVEDKENEVVAKKEEEPSLKRAKELFDPIDISIKE